MTKPKFHAEFFREYWQCGDGCCSDSWINMDLSKDGKLIESWEELRGIYDLENATIYAKEIVESVLEYDDSQTEYDLEVDF